MHRGRLLLFFVVFRCVPKDDWAQKIVVVAHHADGMPPPGPIPLVFA